MAKLIDVLRTGTIFGLAALFAVDPAIAGVALGPAPVIAAGLPALALFAAGYYVIRKRRG